MADSNVSYTVTLPLELTGELEQFLRDRDVNFRPRDMATKLRDAATHPQVLMGFEAQDLLDLINRELQRNGTRPLVPGNPETWTLAQLHEFLDLALHHFGWDEKNRLTGLQWPEEEIPWTELASGYPQLFGAVPGRGPEPDELMK